MLVLETSTPWCTVFLHKNNRFWNWKNFEFLRRHVVYKNSFTHPLFPVSSAFELFSSVFFLTFFSKEPSQLWPNASSPSKAVLHLHGCSDARSTKNSGSPVILCGIGVSNDPSFVPTSLLIVSKKEHSSGILVPLQKPSVGCSGVRENRILLLQNSGRNNTPIS